MIVEMGQGQNTIKLKHREKLVQRVGTATKTGQKQYKIHHLCASTEKS